MDNFHVRNTAALAAAIGIEDMPAAAERLLRSSMGSSVIAHSMSAEVEDSLRSLLREKIAAKAEMIQEGLNAATEETSERGVAILNVLREAETPVMTLLDALREMPSRSRDPISFLKSQKIDENFMKTLGLREGMSRSECQEVLERHLGTVLQEVGIRSGVRNLCKLAVHGENYYHNLSDRLKLVSTIADGIANLCSTLVVKAAALLGKGVDPEKTTKVFLGAAAALIVTGCAFCPPLAIAAGVVTGVFLLAKAVSALTGRINENLAQSVLEGRDTPWSQFFSGVFQDAGGVLGDAVDAAGKAAAPLVPGQLGKLLRRESVDEEVPSSAPEPAGAKSQATPEALAREEESEKSGAPQNTPDPASVPSGSTIPQSA